MVTFTEFYRKTIENPSDENLSNIYRLIEHLSKTYRTPIGHHAIPQGACNGTASIIETRKCDGDHTSKIVRSKRGMPRSLLCPHPLSLSRSSLAPPVFATIAKLSAQIICDCDAFWFDVISQPAWLKWYRPKDMHPLYLVTIASEFGIRSNSPSY